MKKNAKIAAACGACAAAVGLTVLVITLNKNDKDVPAPTSVIEATTEAPTEPPKPTLPDNWADTVSYVPSESGMSQRAKIFLEKYNPDVVGWIRLHGTIMDYPVLIDPGEVEEGHPFYGPEKYSALSYYLDHDLDRSYKRAGSLFLDCRDEIGSDLGEFSENFVIYGHNMLNNSMFGSLRRYRQDYSFINEAPFLQFSNNYRTDDYVIFAFLKTSGTYAETDFDYWNQEELDTKTEFDAYVNRCRRDQMVDTGVDVQFGDHLLTLSTCYSDEDNSRFIVIARRLRDGETANNIDSIAHTEEWLEKKKAEEASKAEAEAASSAAAT